MSLNNVIKSIIAANAASGLVPFNTVVYVDLNGDNSDGSSWAKAYTTIAGAIAACGAGSNIIMIAPGTYTIAAAITLPATVDQIALIGIDAHAVIFDITAANPAIGIAFDKPAYLENIHVIEHEAETSFAFAAKATVINCSFDSDARTGGKYSLLFIGTTDVVVTNCRFEGLQDQSITTYAIRFTQCYYCLVDNCQIHGFNIQIYLFESKEIIIKNSEFTHEVNTIGGAPIAIKETDSNYLTYIKNQFNFRYYGGSPVNYLYFDNATVLSSVVMEDNNFHYVAKDIKPAIDSPVSFTTGAAAHEWGAVADILGGGIYNCGIRIRNIVFHTPSVADTYFYVLYYKGTRIARGMIPANGIVMLDTPFFVMRDATEKFELAIASILGAGATYKAYVEIEGTSQGL